MMNPPKPKPSFAIDNILFQYPSGPAGKQSNHSFGPAYKMETNAVGPTTLSPQDRNELPKHLQPIPIFPNIFDFNPAKYYLPHLPIAQPRFSPRFNYLEQYTNALQKSSLNLWPFYSSPYNGYFPSGHSFKRKGGQVRFSPQQTQSLERRFASHKYLSPEDRKKLATELKLSDRQVKTWFQNRRAKWRRCQTAQSADEKHQVTAVAPNIQHENLHKCAASSALLQSLTGHTTPVQSN